MYHKLCHWNTWSYASRPNFCLNDDKSGKARHGNFAPSCVTIESNPYLVSLFDFIIATLLHNRDVKRKQSIIRIIPKTFKHCSVNQVFQYLLPCNCIKHGNFFPKEVLVFLQFKYRCSKMLHMVEVSLEWTISTVVIRSYKLPWLNWLKSKAFDNKWKKSNRTLISF